MPGDQEMELHYGRPRGIDFATLVRRMPDEEFTNLTRSTIPLLFYWRDPAAALKKVCGLLTIDPPSGGQLCFEFPVPSVGRSKASFTDIMFLSEPLALGVEGKWREPGYDTVEKWLGKGKDRKKRETVRDHWKELIRRRTGQIVDALIPTTVYQMLHRTASVCAVGARRPVLLYQVFQVDGEKPRAEYEKELRRLAEAIGAAGRLEIGLQFVPFKKTPAYRAVERSLKATEPETRPLLVRAAVLQGNLFEVLPDSDRIIRIC